MIFLHLNSKMNNFKKIGSFLTWEIDNLQFPNKNVALSNFVVNFKSKLELNYIKITTNLIQQNAFNSDGTLYCSNHNPSRDNHVIAPPNYQFWKVDIRYPRLIKIHLENVNIDLVNFISLTLVIE